MRRLASLLLLLAGQPAAAETLVASLSTDRIAITSNFNGASLVVFGAIEREAAAPPRSAPYDVVVTVRGPRGAVTVREKQRWGPFWFNSDSRKYIAIPAFLAVLTNRPLDDIGSEDLRNEFRLGVSTQVSEQGDLTKTLDPEEAAFREALILIRKAHGLFRERDDGVKFLTPSVFRAVARIPGTVPLGGYAVDISVLSGGVQVARNSISILVEKSGAEEDIASAARRQPLLYGLGVAILALLFGWIASLIFRRD